MGATKMGEGNREGVGLGQGQTDLRLEGGNSKEVADLANKR